MMRSSWIEIDGFNNIYKADDIVSSIGESLNDWILEYFVG